MARYVLLIPPRTPDLPVCTVVFVGQKPDLVAAEAQITHTTRKINNALKTKEEVARSEVKLAEKVGMLEKELVNVRKAADAAQGMLPFVVILLLSDCVDFGRVEESRKASQHNMALSESSLEEYRKL
jgi:structural maintenance of chromosome 1